MPNMDEPWRRDEISQSQYYALKKVKFYVMYKKERKEVKLLSYVRLFVTPWTAACQTLLTLEFSRQEYWSG